MRIFHIVSSGDAQSIPTELALRLAVAKEDLRVAIFLEQTDKIENDPRLIYLGAKTSRDWSAIGRLKTALAEFDPDIVHVHHAASSLWGSWIARFGRRKGKGPRRIILKTEHNDRQYQGVKNDAINLLTYPLLNGVICNSESTFHSLTKTEHALVRDHAWVTYNGVDLDRVTNGIVGGASLRAHWDLPEGCFCIGAVGRFVAQKNFARLIEGFAKAVATSSRPLVLMLVGSGPLEEPLRALTTRLGLEDSVIFTGALERDQVYQHLGAIDGFIMPSLWEGFCNAAVEAMAAGLPIAASNIDVLHEVLGETPCFFDPRSVESIAQAIEEMSSATVDAMLQQGRANQIVSKRYDIAIAADKYMALYAHLIAERGAPS